MNNKIAEKNKQYAPLQEERVGKMISESICAYSGATTFFEDLLREDGRLSDAELWCTLDELYPYILKGSKIMQYLFTNRGPVDFFTLGGSELVNFSNAINVLQGNLLVFINIYKNFGENANLETVNKSQLLRQYLASISNSSLILGEYIQNNQIPRKLIDHEPKPKDIIDINSCESLLRYFAIAINLIVQALPILQQEISKLNTKHDNRNFLRASSLFSQAIKDDSIYSCQINLERTDPTATFNNIIENSISPLLKIVTKLDNLPWSGPANSNKIMCNFLQEDGEYIEISLYSYFYELKMRLQSLRRLCLSLAMAIQDEDIKTAMTFKKSEIIELLEKTRPASVIKNRSGLIITFEDAFEYTSEDLIFLELQVFVQNWLVNFRNELENIFLFLQTCHENEEVKDLVYSLTFFIKSLFYNRI